MLLDRTTPPSSKQIDSVDFIQPTKYTLDNHIPVFVINAGDQELVRIEFIFKNVNWDVRNPLLASTVNAMLSEGTATLSAAEIASKIDFCGAFFQTEFTADYSQVSLYSLNKQLNFTVPIVKDVLRNSIFPDKELNIFKKNQKERLKINEEKNDFLARRKFNQVLFGDTLYGYQTNEEDLDLLNREDLLKFFHQAYQPQNCTIIVAGNVKNSLIELLNNLFGDWKDEHHVTLNNFKFIENKEKEHYISKPNSLQAAIKIGIPSINRKHPEFPEVQVLNTILGGYFGSRLMNNIREDKGYTYGIGSGIVSQQQIGYFIISTEVGVDVKDATLHEIEYEIEQLKTQLVGFEELSLVKNYLMGSLLGSLENAFSHADKFKNVYLYNLDLNYYQNYIEIVKNISSERIKYLANKYLNYDDFYKIVVG